MSFSLFKAPHVVLYMKRQVQRDAPTQSRKHFSCPGTIPIVHFVHYDDGNSVIVSVGRDWLLGHLFQTRVMPGSNFSLSLRPAIVPGGT